MDSVKEYKKRRKARMQARMDAEEKGRWVTTENDNRIHFNESGEPDKGNPYVLAAMKGGKGTKNGKTEKASERRKRLKKEIRDFIEGPEAVFGYGYWDLDRDKWHSQTDDLKEKLGMSDNEFTELWNEVHHEIRMEIDPETEREWYRGKRNTEEKRENKEYENTGNKDYGYGPADSHKSMKKEKAAKSESSGTYESFPFTLRSKKEMTPENRKKIRDTVSRFMKEAKNGEVYECGGGFGSSGGQKFQVTTYRGSKPALVWLDENGKRTGHGPVQMNRANVESFIRNGAKLVK